MKRFLSFILTAVLALTASAFESSVTPQGTPVWYTMDAYLLNNPNYVTYGLPTQISMEGDAVYFKSLFPLYAEEMWTKGVKSADGTTLTIDHTAVVGTDIFYDEDDKPFEAELMIGDAIFDRYNELIDIEDVVLSVDGDLIYSDDDVNDPSHTIVLYYLYKGESLEAADYISCPSFKLYTGATEAVTVPEGAEHFSYLYSYDDSNLNTRQAVAEVAVFGNDYYFSRLIPEIGGWVKGVRADNVITIEPGQVMQFEPQVFKFGGYNQYGNGRLENVEFNVTADGTLTQSNPDLWCVSYLTNGSLFDYARNFVLTPFNGELITRPAQPTDVQATYYSEIRLNGIMFYQEPVSEDGVALDPQRLGYYLYVDGQRYSFKKSNYHYLYTDETYFIPYGYMDTDDLNECDFYCYGSRNEWIVYVGGYNTFGIQSVYRGDNDEYRSDVVTVTKAGTVTVEPDPLSAVSSITTDPITDDTYYDFAGRKTTVPTGLVIRNGRKMIK